MKQRLIFVLLFFVVLISMPLDVNAEEKIRKEVFKTLDDAFQAQVSLSEEERTLSEVIEILAPHFTERAMFTFLSENLREEKGKYFTLGTDFALYYVPFFTYSKETKVKYDEDHLFVYEFFPKNNFGPVLYDDHYEEVLMVKEDEQWKIAEIHNNLEAEEIWDMKLSKSKGMPKFYKNMNYHKNVFKLVFDPLGSFFQYSNPLF